MYCVALTGTIASGKSTVAAHFKTLGVDVISADDSTRALTARGMPAYTLIIEHFGDTILKQSGELDRARLRHIIFNDTKQRLWLEQLLHPLIRNKIEAQVAHCESAYCVIEIPLLFNVCDYPYLNRVLLVQAIRTEQLSRLITRDNCTKEQAQAILLAQPDDELRLSLADDLLINDGTLNQLKDKVAILHQQYILRAM